MTNFYYVYILVSEIDGNIHYTGTTTELAARLKEHNQGTCTHTKKYRPVNLPDDIFKFRPIPSIKWWRRTFSL